MYEGAAQIKDRSTIFKEADIIVSIFPPGDEEPFKDSWRSIIDFAVGHIRMIASTTSWLNIHSSH